MQCHDLSRCTRGYDQEGWRNNIHMMLNGGAILPQDEIELGGNIWPSLREAEAGRRRVPGRGCIEDEIAARTPARGRMIRSRLLML